MAFTFIQWNNVAGGNYGVATDWTPNGVPNSASDLVALLTLANAYTVDATKSYTAGFLEVDDNVTFSISQDSVYSIASSVTPYSNVYNTGAISVAAGSYFRLGLPTTGDSAEIIGTGVTSVSGTLDFFANYDNLLGGQIVALSGGSILGENTSPSHFEIEDGKIRGYGTIGNGSSAATDDGLYLTVAEEGVINANGGAGQVLTLATGPNQIEDAGVITTTGAGGLTIDSTTHVDGQLEAEGTGILDVNGVLVDGLGTVSVGAGGTIQLHGGELQLPQIYIGSATAPGGTITTTSGNTARPTVVNGESTVGADAISSDIFNWGTIVVAANSVLGLNTYLQNNGAGEIELLGGPGEESVLEIYQGSASFHGGQLVLGGAGDNAIISDGQGEQLSNFSTLSGAGTIGDAGGYTSNDLRLYNGPGGVVDANSATGLTIEADAAAVAAGSESSNYNVGLVEATGSGVLTIDGAFNNGGEILAAGNSEVVINGEGLATSQNPGVYTGGGYVATTGSGEILLEDGGEIAKQGYVSIGAGGALTTASDGKTDALETTVDNSGAVTVANDSTLVVDGQLDGAGSVDLAGPASVLDLLAGNALDLFGGGTLTMHGADIGVNGTSSNDTVLRIRDDMIVGTGTIGASGMTIDNESGASLEASGGTLNLYGTGGTLGISSYSYGIINSASLIAASGGTLELNAATYSPGELIAQSGGHIVANDAVDGSGDAYLQGNGSIEFKAEDGDTDVHFAAGADATLIIDDPANFYGAIYGFGAGDSIDLTSIAYNPNLTLDPSFGSQDGLVVLMNGSTVVQPGSGLYLVGDYSAETLAAQNLKWSVSAINSSDPADGTKVTLVAGQGGTQNIFAPIEWNNVPGGFYDDAMNWSSNVVPNSGSDAIQLPTLAAAYSVIVIDSNTAGYLEIDGGATLAIIDDSVYSIASSGTSFTDAADGIPYSNLYNLGTVFVDAGSSLVLGLPAPNDTAEIIGTGVIANLGALDFDTTYDSVLGGETIALLGGSIGGATSSPSYFEIRDATVQGYGIIGNGSSASANDGLFLTVTLDGLVNADGDDEALTLNTGGNQIEDAGVIETTAASGLTIDSGMQLDGQLEADGTGALDIHEAFVSGFGVASVAAQGTIQLNGGGLQLPQIHIGSAAAPGGTLTTTSGDTGRPTVANDDAKADADIIDADVFNWGVIAVESNSVLSSGAYITNNGAGEIELLGAPSGASTLEVFAGGSTVHGGQIALGGNGNDAIISDGQGEQLSNFSTIIGAGTIGDSGGYAGSYLRLYNAPVGVVDANSATGLTIEADAAAVAAGSESPNYNVGLVEATGSGVLTFDGAFGNAGEILAAGNGKVVIDGEGLAPSNNPGVYNDGGYLVTTGSGEILLEDGGEIANQGYVSIGAGGALTTASDGMTDAVKTTVNNSGAVTVANNSTLVVDSNWVGAGSINLAGANSVLDVLAGNTFTLLGGGVLTMHGGNIGINGTSSNDTVLRDRGDMIEGKGAIGATGMSIENDPGASIEASGGTLTLYGTAGSLGLANYGVGINNGGEMIAGAGSTLDLTAATYSPGELIAQSGGHIVANDAVYGAGVTDLQGNGSVEFKAENDTDVHFAAGADATLTLDDPASYFGGTYGFGKGDNIDFTGIAYNSNLTVNSTNFGPLDGSLLLMNGSAAVSPALYVIGNYTEPYLAAHDLTWSVSEIKPGNPAAGVQVSLVTAP